jgi:tetratricopeptide (TPR) repeat protein
MPDQEPANDDAQTSASGDSPSIESRRRARSGGMTPEQRRFLGPGRSFYSQPNEAQTAAGTPAPPERPVPVHERKIGRKRVSSGPGRALEMQNVALVAGALLLLGITFFVGKRYEYWKYAIVSRSNAKILESEANKYPGVSADELIDRALAAERLGDWQEAATRYVAAKFKNNACPGLLFRAGKLYYDHAAFDGADALFDRAIALGENMDAANYYRGMIAVGRDDFPAAERFFEAASNAAPFNADYLYSWAEALRKHLQPKTAVAYYEKAAVRATDREAEVCRFKARMAMVEAGDVEQLQKELEHEQSKGPLSVDWVMTAAALQIHAGDIEKAIETVKRARGSDRSVSWGTFATCVGDRFFSNATRSYPDLAEACKMSPSTLRPVDR